MPSGRGLDNREMVDAIHEEELRGLYLAGEDMISADSNAIRLAGACLE